MTVTNKDSNINVYGARSHNLKNIDVSIPRNKLVVITGLSGSGKSSLAFDTIFAEGQRRYLETFSAYARQYIGNLTRTDVDKITGLSPVISIEQKTVSKNPRSTVGTITEIYDFLRLLYARASIAQSPDTGEKMIKYSEKELHRLIECEFNNKKITVLAPIIKARKGHYRDLFEKLIKQGYTKVLIDGEITDLSHGMRLDRYKIHDISLIIDRIQLSKNSNNRLTTAISTGLKKGKGEIILMDTKGLYKHYSKWLMCPSSGFSLPEPEPNLFSFNSPHGACQLCNGLGKISDIDIKKIIPDETKSIKKGGIVPLGNHENNWTFKQIEVILKNANYDINNSIDSIDKDTLNVILYGSNKLIKIIGNSGVHEVVSNFEGIINIITRQQKEGSSKAKRWVDNFTNKTICTQCNGTRLKKNSLLFKVADKDIGELSAMDTEQLFNWISLVQNKLTAQQLKIGAEVLKEIKKRLEFLLNVGLNYISLNLPASTLSGGEAQRIRLATQIGSELTGVLYILDEPSIGLHQRDNYRLINSLKKLRNSNNSIIVVEHDKNIMLEADHLIDIGPGAGINGGQIVSQGNAKDILNLHSITAQYIKGEKTIPYSKSRRKNNGEIIELHGANGNNLKNITTSFPLGVFICVTGVSGSGKSTLINDTLFPILSQHFYKSIKKPLAYKSIKGLELIDKVIGINQLPIGRTPRSNPATYTGVFNDIRTLFTQLPESKIRGYKPGRFSFNIKGGRCESCKGAGLKLIEMNFLPDVYVKCDDCHGRRYNRETLEVRYKGKSINDILNMSILDAETFFKDIPVIFQKLMTLNKVGLGYVTLGQSSTTLSGGEAQRIKLASELSKKDTGKTLYILDEPTTGLHFQDIQMLINVLNQLVDNGNTVIVIEHNMDIIKIADHIIDIGPEGGKQGGEIISTGTPEQISKINKSYTGQFLIKELV